MHITITHVGESLYAVKARGATHFAATLAGAQRIKENLKAGRV